MKLTKRLLKYPIPIVATIVGYAEGFVLACAFDH